MYNVINVKSEDCGIYTVTLPSWKASVLREVAEVEGFTFRLTDKHYTEFERDGFTSCCVGQDKVIVELDKENNVVVRYADEDEFLYRVEVNGYTDLLTDDESEANEYYNDAITDGCSEASLYYCDTCIAEYEARKYYRGF